MIKVILGQNLQRSWAEVVKVSAELGCNKCGSGEQHLQNVGTNTVLVCDTCKAVLATRPITKGEKP